MSENQEPWKTEPDYEYFTHMNVSCLVARMQYGHLNGYIALPGTHPWAGKEIEAIRGLGIEFIWPITFVRHATAGVLQASVLGFDTMSEFCPNVPVNEEVNNPDHYVPFDEVMRRTKQLAAEARSVGKVKFPHAKRWPVTQAWDYPWNIFK